jgi:hypothetical protein
VDPAGPCGRLIGEAQQATLIPPDTALQLTPSTTMGLRYRSKSGAATQ